MVIGEHGQHTVLVQLHVVVDIKEEVDFVTILLQNMVEGDVKGEISRICVVTLTLVQVNPQYCLLLTHSSLW